MKTTIWMAIFAVAATCAALAEVPPVLTEEPVVQKWGAEADDEVQRDGLLFWRDDCGALYIGDGETPGGKAVCVGLPPDLYSWTNDVSANGHALLWGGGWSQQAEGGSLLVRLGTNSWLRFVAADAGTLANLAVSDLDQANGTMRLTADTADPGAVLLVATNLLDPEAWQPATNGEIVATTDASTTWLITLLDPPFEVYRVRTSVTLEAGIHAERTLHANAGIEMGGEQWDAWPDIGAIATNAADAAVAPVAGDLADHAADTDNPHAVTAAQVGALPLTGGVIAGSLMITNTTPDVGGRFSHGGPGTYNGQIIPTGAYASYSTAEGEAAQAIIGKNSYASGYFVTATGFTSRATGGRTFAGGTCSEARGYGANATNDFSHVWSGVSTFEPGYGSHGDGSWNIDPAGGLPNMWVGETNMADHLAAAVAPVKARVGALEKYHERPETCYLYWPPEYVSTNGGADGTNYVNIPTNFPTRRLNLTVCDAGLSNCFVNVPLWVPDSPKEIVLRFERTSGAPTNRNAKIFINGLLFNSSPTYATYRLCRINYDPDCGAWRSDVFQLPARGYFYPDGIRTIYPTNFPATVEEWVAVQDGSSSQTLSISPSLSPSLSPLSPAVLQPDASLNNGSLDELDGLDEPDGAEES